MVLPGDPFLPLADASADTTQSDTARADSVRNMGRSVTFPGRDITQPFNAPRDLVYLEFDRPKVCTLMLQASGPGIAITVITGIGGSARFSRTFPMPVGIPQSLQVFGRVIEVQGTSIGNFGPVTVSGGLVEGEINPFAELWSTYVPVPAGATFSSQGPICPAISSGFGSQAGKLLKAHGSLFGGTAGTNYWMMFFDALGPAVFVNGAVPLYVIGPLVGAQPSNFSIDDTSRPDIFFNQGLQWSLSTSPATLLMPTDGVIARVDASWGT